MLTNLIAIDSPAPWDPGTWTDPYTDAQGIRFEVDPAASGSDALAFAVQMRAAYDALPLTGGTIRVYPGTAPYVIDTSIVLGDLVGHVRKPVKVVFEKGAVVRHDTGTAAAFRINTPVEIEGLYAEYDWGATTADAAFFKILPSDDPVTVGANFAGGTTGSFLRNVSDPDWEDEGYRVGDWVTTSSLGSPLDGTWVVVGFSSGSQMTVMNPGAVSGTAGLIGSLVPINRGRTFKLSNSRFSVAPTGTNIPGYFIVSAEGDAAKLMMGDVTVQDTTLEIRGHTLSSTFPSMQSACWTGSEYTGTPRGIGFIKATYCLGLMVHGCRYVRDGTAGYDESPVDSKHYGGMFAWLRNCHEAIISNVISYGVHLGSSADNFEALPFIQVSTDSPGGNEGAHCDVRGFFVENLTFKHFLYAYGGSWINVENVKLGRIFPGRTTSAVRFDGNPAAQPGRACEVIRLTTHNVNGPNVAGTITGSTGASTLGLTDIDQICTVGDWLEISGTSTDLDGFYKVTATATNLVTVDPPPPTTSGAGTAKMQYWAVHMSTKRVGQIRMGNHALRKSSAPLYRLDNCESIFVDPDEPIDTSFSGT